MLCVARISSVDFFASVVSKTINWSKQETEENTFQQGKPKYRSAQKKKKDYLIIFQFKPHELFLAIFHEKGKLFQTFYGSTIKSQNLKLNLRKK